ncbi:hypothetical protein MPLSOD_420011 [Mesorhizobium sp. SOD10]|nr:hypothetical protein MPLSOD_420011 [Mesorhizobium sp. SOD10]
MLWPWGSPESFIERVAFDWDFVRDWTNAPFLVRSDNARFLRSRDLLHDDMAQRERDYLVWDDETKRLLPAALKSKSAALSASHVVATKSGDIWCRTALDLYRDAVAPFDPDTVERLTGVAPTTFAAFAQAVNVDVKKFFLEPDFTVKVAGADLKGKAKLDV